MYHFRRNKSELIVLTGAIYSFVAYLTAFALEILFLVDLTRRSNEILSTLATSTPADRSTGNNGAGGISQPTDQLDTSATGSPLSDRLSFESLQTHITISSLTIAILYFIIFITSLVLIVALILRSTFILLIWLCAMTTMYLPEFGLVIYVSVYSWGLSTRNGQTELIFYLFRAALNLIFILRAYKLYKQWNYEKNFFRLKSGSASGFSTNFSPSYDSPYFIGGPSPVGDSLTTTINPIFSSTLNLNRYDFVRDQFNHQNRQASSSANDSGGTSPATQNSLYAVSSSDATSNHRHREHLGRATSTLYSKELPSSKQFGKQTHARSSYEFDDNLYGSSNDGTRRFYLGDPNLNTASRDRAAAKRHETNRQPSMLSFNDQYGDYELDLEYRTLDKSPSRTHRDQVNARDSPVARRHQQQTTYNAPPIRRLANTTGQRFEPHKEDYHHPVDRSSMLARQNVTNMSQSHDDLAYSTQSLDRRNSRDFTLSEQVVLRPLGHQPFEYLHRPGSTTNLNYN